MNDSFSILLVIAIAFIPILSLCEFITLGVWLSRIFPYFSEAEGPASYIYHTILANFTISLFTFIIIVVIILVIIAIVWSIKQITIDNSSTDIIGILKFCNLDGGRL